ncbi:MAG: glycosyltransferase family 39 protein [Chloroflexi bacterium]|nr:glycosyltransferase family 39 protein [Chloroflexota bacterium]
MDADQLTPGRMPAKHRSALFLTPVALLVLAFAVRAIGLADQSLWYDEGYTVMFAQHDIPHLFTQTARLELNTPLHYILLHVWMIGSGSSAFATRLLSVFAGVVTVALAYALARHAGATSPGPGQWAMLLVAVWPVCASLSQEVRMYALLLCTSTLAVVQFVLCLRSPRRVNWLLWGLFNIIAFASHVLGALIFTAQAAVLAVWCLRRAPGRRSRAALLSLALTAIVMMAWTSYLVAQAGTYGTMYSSRLDYGTILLQSLAANLLPRLQPDALLIPAAFLCTGLIALITLARFVNRRPGVGISGLVVALSVVLIAAFCALTGKFAARYAATTAPLLAASAGMVLGSPAYRPAGAGTGNVLKKGSALAAVGLCLVGLALTHVDARYANEDFRGAAAYLHQQIAPDETILLVSGHFAPVFEYYYGADGWSPIPPDPVLNVRNTLDYDLAAPALNRALTGKHGTWLLLWQDDVIDPTGVVPTLLNRISNRLQPDMDVSDFYGLRLLHYRFDTPYEPLPATIPHMDSQVETSDATRGLSSLGCHQFRPPRSGDAMMELACFWQLKPGTTLPYDTQVSLRFTGQDSQQITQSDQMLAPVRGLPYLPFDKPITSFYFIPIPTDLAPGVYSVRAIPYTPAEQLSPQVVTQVKILP